MTELMSNATLLADSRDAALNHEVSASTAMAGIDDAALAGSARVSKLIGASV